MTTTSWLGLSLAASLAAHALLGWELSGVHRQRGAPPDRDPFEVRLLTLPQPEREPEPLPAPPEPPPPPKPKPSVKAPEPLRTAAEPPPSDPAPAQVNPAPTTAPAALLAEAGAEVGPGIVQLAGAAIGAVSNAVPAPSVTTPRVTAAPPTVSTPLARLSDLSRKPKAPPLDAALRQNYPVELRQRGTEGQAEVRVVIDSRGRVGEIALVSESAVGFAEACRKTLVGSRWSGPLDREGQPVSTRLTYRCRFQIER